MKRSSKIVLGVVALLLVVFAVYFIVRQPPLSDQDQIIGQLETARAAAERHDAGGITAVVSTDFKSEAIANKQQLYFYLARAFRNSGKLRVVLSAPTVVVQGDSATSTCQMTVYNLDRVGPRFDQPVTLNWRREEGRRLLVLPTRVWRIVGAQNVGALPGDQD